MLTDLFRDARRQPIWQARDPEDPGPGRRPGRGRLGFVPQMRSQGCAGACLAMVLRLYGACGWERQIAARLGHGGKDIDAETMLCVARDLGLDGSGYEVDAEQALQLPPGSILHWESNHYVVFERATRTMAYILDPRFGRRVMTHGEFRERFSGVALTFAPTEKLRSAGDGRPTDRRSLSTRLGLAGGLLWKARLVTGTEKLLATLLLMEACALIVGMAGWPLPAYTFVPLTAAEIVFIVWAARLKWAVGGSAFSGMSARLVESLPQLPAASLVGLQDGDILARAHSGFELRAAVAGLAVSGPTAAVAGGLLASVLALWQPAVFAILLPGLVLQGVIFSGSLRGTDAVSNEVAAQRAAVTRAEQAMMRSLRSRDHGGAAAAIRQWRLSFDRMVSLVTQRDRWNSVGTAGAFAVNVLIAAAVVWWGRHAEKRPGEQLMSLALVALVLRYVGVLLSAEARRARVLAYVVRVEDLAEGVD